MFFFELHVNYRTNNLDDATDRFLGSPRESDRLVAERDMIRVITAEAPYISVNITPSALYLRRGLTGPSPKRGMWPDSSFTAPVQVTR